MDAKQIARQLIECDPFTQEYKRRVLVAGVEVFSGDEREAEGFYDTVVLAVEEKLRDIVR